MCPDGQDLTQLHTFLWCFKNVVFLNEHFFVVVLGFLFFTSLWMLSLYLDFHIFGR